MKDDSYLIYEVESNGEKLCITKLTLGDKFEKVKVKVGDTIEIPNTPPSKNYNKKLNKKYPKIIMALDELKVVK